MKVFRLLLFIMTAAVFVSQGCKPEDEMPPVVEIPFWKKVQGNYTVTDLGTMNQYQMSIEIITDTTFLPSSQMEINDTIILRNFNNQFPILKSKYQTCMTTNNENCLSIGSEYGIRDYANNRWVVVTYDDPATTFEEMTWKNGEITFNFHMFNTLWWLPDGTTYHDTLIKQRAVRIGNL